MLTEQTVNHELKEIAMMWQPQVSAYTLAVTLLHDQVEEDDTLFLVREALYLVTALAILYIGKTDKSQKKTINQVQHLLQSPDFERVVGEQTNKSVKYHSRHYATEYRLWLKVQDRELIRSIAASLLSKALEKEDAS